MQNKKGFTLVELVIVIAVIAILSGVLVGTFANIINTANESANLQKQKSAIDEIKANDILDEIDNENWYSINDFESKVAKELSRLFINDSENIDTKIEEYLQDAVYDYEENITKTNLTDEDLVMALVINSVNKPIFGGVTYYQAKAIVDTIYEDNNSITDIIKKNIVNNGLKKQLTAYDFAKYVKENKTALLDNQTINALHKDNNYSFNFDFNVKPIDNLHNDEVTYWVDSENNFHYKVTEPSELKAILESYNATSYVINENNYYANSKLVIHIMNSLDVKDIKMDGLNEIAVKQHNIELLIIGEGNSIIISTDKNKLITLRGNNVSTIITFENLKFVTTSDTDDTYTISCTDSPHGYFYFKNCIIAGKDPGKGIRIKNKTLYYTGINFEFADENNWIVYADSNAYYLPFPNN